MKWKFSIHHNWPKSKDRVFRNLDIGVTGWVGFRKTIGARVLVHVFLILLPMLLVNSVMGGEPERRERVRSLINSLADESLEKRQATYIELRDTSLRKRDISELSQVIARNSNPEVAKSLKELVTYMREPRWRFPDKGWTADISEIIKSYEKKFEDLGVHVSIGPLLAHRPKQILDLEIWQEGLIPAEKKMQIISLILTLEPEALGLRWGDWANINFVSTLTNLKEFTIEETLVSSLTPLKGMANLNTLTILNSQHVTDLSPIKNLAKLTRIDLRGTKVTDLTPLKDLKLIRIDLRGTKVTDITPLNVITGLYIVTEDGFIIKNE